MRIRARPFPESGNTYYDIGRFAHAIEAYLNALKYTPRSGNLQ